MVVPTRDRHALLGGCLASLEEAVREGAEVLVVDDGSADPVSVPDGIGLLRTAPEGLNAARNAGAAATRAPLIAFLDDDVLVGPGWARALRAAAAEGADGIAGRVTLDLPGPEPRWLRPHLRGYLSEYELGDRERWLAADDPPPVGANCACTRAALDAAGGFRPGLDRMGGSLLSGGETDLFRRLLAGGARLRYAPAARVRHRIGPDRLTVGYFRRRALAQGMSDGPEPRWKTLARPLRAVPVLVRSGPVPALLYLDYARGRWRGA